jgi:hypothetical protein
MGLFNDAYFHTPSSYKSAYGRGYKKRRRRALRKGHNKYRATNPDSPLGYKHTWGFKNYWIGF